MKYIVLQQFIPGLDQIWVARLEPTDPIYEFDTYEECAAKAAELQAKVDVAEKKSADTNTKLAKKSKDQSAKVVTKTLVVKQYIDREVTKYDSGCVIPQPFVSLATFTCFNPKPYRQIYWECITTA